MKFNPLLYILAIFGLIHIFGKIDKDYNKQPEQSKPHTAEHKKEKPEIDFSTPIYKTRDIT